MDWRTNLIGGGNRQALVAVFNRARDVLAEWPPDMSLSTRELAEFMWPTPEVVSATDIKARQRMFRLLMRLAETDLADCAEKDKTAKTRFGGHPWRWHCGRPWRSNGPLDKTCPHCGGILP